MTGKLIDFTQMHSVIPILIVLEVALPFPEGVYMRPEMKFCFATKKICLNYFSLRAK